MVRTPKSVVVLDNCSIHHITEVTSILQEVGELVHYLPPYSPDFNPMEESFSKVKSVLRSQDSHLLDVKILLLNSFLAIRTLPSYKENWQCELSNRHA